MQLNTRSSFAREFVPHTTLHFPLELDELGTMSDRVKVITDPGQLPTGYCQSTLLRGFVFRELLNVEDASSVCIVMVLV